MADETIGFKLDLDNIDFLKSGTEAFEVINRLGSPENLAGLIEGLGKVGVALGVVGLAAYGFKEAIDLTQEGEQIKLIETQFETLAAQAGLSATELKAGMENAAGGLLSTNELLQASNKYIVEMGGNASKLPEIMELARKATVLFGGDLLTNFNNIAQAMAAGNVRMLKHYGIIVDTTSATQKYAESLGIETSELSEAGKKQALMNAALEAGQKAFSGVNADVKTSAMIWQQFKTAMNEVREAVAILFERYLGPPLRKALEDLAHVAEKTALILKSTFGTGAEAADASLRLVQMRMDETKKKIDELEARKVKLGFDPAIGETESLKKSLVELQAQYDKLNASATAATNKKKEEEKQAIAASDHEARQDVINKEARKKNEEKFQQEILAINKKTEAEKQKNITSTEQIEEAIRQQDLAKDKAHEQAIAKIKAEHAGDTRRQRALIDAEDKRFNAESENRELENDRLREKLMENYEEHSETAFQGIGRAAHNMSAKAKSDLHNMGLLGNQTMDSFKQHSTAAFEQIGQGIAANQNIAQAASNAMKAMFLNMIADRAEAEGQMLLLSGIWPPNPAAIAAGGALIALGAALHSVAGSLGQSSSSGISGGGGGAGISATDAGAAAGAPGAASTSPDQQTQLAQQQTVQRSVTVNIAGNYLNTSESQRTLMELMRQESDSTNFSYNKIGV